MPVREDWLPVIDGSHQAGANVLAAQTDPQTAAQAEDYARRLGIPSPTAERNLPEVKRRAGVQAATSAMGAAPAVRQWIASDPQNAAVSHDQIPDLADVEHKARAWWSVKNPLGQIESGLEDWGASVLRGVPTLLATLNRGLSHTEEPAPYTGPLAPPTAPLSTGSEILGRRAAAPLQRRAIEIQTQTPAQTLAERFIHTGVQMAAGIGLTVAQPWLGTAGFAGQGADEAAQEASAQGETGTPGADTAIVGNAAIQGLFDRLGVAAVIGRPAAALISRMGPAGRSAILRGVAHIAASATAQGSEQAARQATSNYLIQTLLNPDRQISEGVGESALFGAVIGGGVGAAHMAVAHEAAAPLRTEAHAEAMDSLAEAVRASPMPERSPERFTALAHQIAGADEVYVPAEAVRGYLQSAQPTESEQFIARNPDILKQLQTATDGADVVIPGGDYIANVMPLPAHDALREDIRTGPAEMSIRQAKEGEANYQAFVDEHGPALQAKVDQATKSAEPARQVAEDVRQQAEGAGIATANARRYAALYAARYETRAARLGTDALTEFQRAGTGEGVRITAGDGPLAGRSLHQVSPERARALPYETKVPDSTELSAAVAGTPGARMDAEGIHLDLRRYQKAEQAGATAIRTGVFYLPRGSAQERYYRASGTNYGGQVRIDGPTLLRAPLVAKGGTGGRAPAAAYDALKGKGAYEAMRNDVLAAVLKWGKVTGEEDVAAVLEKYGADPDLAYEILRYSREGNQLAYAIQENIVAHAVRDAGYDSVVGWSKGKGGPFISEVFDVREATFPDQTGESDLHPSFEQASRGRITFGQGAAIIQLFEGRDASTLIHETGHLWLEELKADAERPDAPDDIKADWEAVKAHLGVKGELSTDQHETFARSFEAYLMEGQAPSAGLASVFHRFRAWLTSIYRHVTSLGVNVSPELRGVFDRMLATDDEIDAVSAKDGGPIFASAADGGMTEAEFTAYRHAQAAYIEGARQRLLDRTMEDVRRQRTKAWKDERARVRQDIAAEVAVRPDVRAFQAVTDPNARVKINRADLDGMFADPRDLLQQRRGPSLLEFMSSKGGVDDTGGELAAMDADKWHVGRPFRRKLVRESGPSVGDMAVSAWEAGYFPDRSSPPDAREFLDSIRQELAGRRIYAMADPELAHQAHVADMAEAAGAAAEPYPELPRGSVANDGIHPDALAGMVGADTGEGVVRDIAALENRRRDARSRGDNRSIADLLTDQQTDEHMVERHGDMLSSGEIAREAMDVLHNEQRATMLDIEMRALGGDARLSKEMLSRFANETVGNIATKSLRPDVFLRAERRAGQLAQRALLKGGDKAKLEALEHKRDQALNFHLYRAARDAETELRKIGRVLARYASNRTLRLMDQDYLDQIHGLLERHELKDTTPGEQATRAAIHAFLAKAEADNETIVDPAALEAPGKPYPEMSVDEVRALSDVIANLAHIGRAQRHIMDGERSRSLESLREEALAKAASVASIKRSASPDHSTNLLRSADLAFTKADFAADVLDANDPRGVFNRVLIDGAADAYVKAKTLDDEFLTRLHEVYDNAPKEVRRTWGNRIEHGLLDPYSGQRLDLTKSHLLAIALNWGNASNKDKLLRGWGWEHDTVKALLDRYMSKADWDFVQGLWHSVGSVWPQFIAAERRLTGVAPPKVLPEAVATPHGEYEGGYWPVAYDPIRSATGERAADSDAAKLFSQAFVGINTSAGAAKTRTDVAAPVFLNLEAVMFKHMREVVRRIAYGDFVLNSNRFLRDPAIRQLVIDKLGPEAKSFFQDWIKRQVNYRLIDPRHVQAADAALRGLRIATVQVGASFNIAIGLEHAAAVSQTIGKIGLRPTAEGFARFWANPKGAIEFAYAKSPELRFRMQDSSREMRDLADDLRANTPLAGPLRPLSKPYHALQHLGHDIFSGINQFGVALPTWMGSYYKSLRDGATDEDAARYAMKMVRETHGGGAEKDVAQVASVGGELAKMWTTFLGYHNSQYNLLRQGIRNKDVGQIFWCIVMASAVSTFVAGRKPAEGEEHDPGAVAGLYGEELLRSLWAGTPIVRNVANFALDVTEGKSPGQASSQLLPPLVRSVGKIGQALADMEILAAHTLGLQSEVQMPEKSVKQLIEGVSLMFGIPGGGQIARTAQYEADVRAGRQAPSGPLQHVTEAALGPPPAP
jgi:hypothetical protein